MPATSKKPKQNAKGAPKTSKDGHDNGGWVNYPGRTELPSQRRHTSTYSLPAPAHEWMQEKQKRDSEQGGVPSHLHCIEGRTYDLSSFDHPGGRWFTDATIGHDVTDAFMTHHIDQTKAKAVLKKYYVTDLPAFYLDKVKAFEWKPNGFYDTLRKKALLEFKKDGKRSVLEATGPTTEFLAYCYLAIFLFVVSFAYTVYSQSFISAIVTGYFLLVAGFGVGHNFFHQKDCWLANCFNLTCFDKTDWRISHAISHHHYRYL